MRKVTGNRLQATGRRTFQAILILFVFLYPIPYTLTPAYAASPNPQPCPTASGGGILLGGCFGFGDIRSLGDTTNKFIPGLFSFLVALVVIYFLWGSFKYIISGGNKEAVAAARGMITHAIIGFVILMFAFIILQFVLSSLFGFNDLQIFQG